MQKNWLVQVKYDEGVPSHSIDVVSHVVYIPVILTHTKQGPVCGSFNFFQLWGMKAPLNRHDHLDCPMKPTCPPHCRASHAKRIQATANTLRVWVRASPPLLPVPKVDHGHREGEHQFGFVVLPAGRFVSTPSEPLNQTTASERGVSPLVQSPGCCRKKCGPLTGKGTWQAKKVA